jgi:hypothetical protein
MAPGTSFGPLAPNEKAVSWAETAPFSSTRAADAILSLE